LPTAITTLVVSTTTTTTTTTITVSVKHPPRAHRRRNACQSDVFEALKTRCAESCDCRGASVDGLLAGLEVKQVPEELLLALFRVVEIRVELKVALVLGLYDKLRHQGGGRGMVCMPSQPH